MQTKSGATWSFGIETTASKIGHNMETIQVYQDKIKGEQNGYGGGGGLRRDEQSIGNQITWVITQCCWMAIGEGQ